MEDKAKSTTDSCALCGLERPLSFHHLIPKKNHRNKWFRKRFTREEMNTRGIYVCRPCHSYVHKVLSEKELGRAFTTRAALLGHPLIQRFVAFQQKKG